MYLGKKGVLEPLLMIPMGLGIATVNAGVMFFDPLMLHNGMGTLFVEAQAGASTDMVKNAADLIYVLQLDFLQPIYTFMFSNGLTYGGYPYLIKLMIPKKIRGIAMEEAVARVVITPGQKLAFAVFICAFLSLLFPVAAPLFFSLFLGIAIRESGLKSFQTLVSETILYSATLFMGLLLGILCEASTILSPEVLPYLLLGMLSLLLSGIGGILGGYVLYIITKGKYNPTIGIAGVSCVPSTAKVAQKCVAAVNPQAMIMQYALGANISGVITTAIIAAAYVTAFAK